MTTIIQATIFTLGVAMMWFSGADGTWKSSNALTYFGMVVCLIGITFPFIVTTIEEVYDMFKNLFK